MRFCLLAVPPRDSLAVIRACVSLKDVSGLLWPDPAWGFCDTAEKRGSGYFLVQQSLGQSSLEGYA